MGGLPRGLQFLWEACLGQNFEKAEEFFRTLEPETTVSIYYNAARDTLQATYGLEAYINTHKDASLEILRHSLLRLPVTATQSLGGISIESMRDNGHVFFQTEPYLHLKVFTGKQLLTFGRCPLYSWICTTRCLA